MPPSVRLIVNPSAGAGRAAKALPGVEAALRDAGVQFQTVHTTSIAHAADLAGQAARMGQVAAAMGGDGMVGCVAGAVAKENGVMAVVPGGRGNDFARVLGIPKDPAGAVAVIAAGHARPIDLGDAGGKPFIGIASLGFDSDANRIANEATLVKGDAVYLYAALKALAAWRPATFTVEGDDWGLRFTGWSVAAANSKAYGGGMFLAPDAEVDDGLLDVVMIGRTTKRRFLANLPKVFSGSHVDDPPVHVRRSTAVRIEADRPFEVYADGDPIAGTPVEIRAVARAVRVLLPA
jgi:YegS/Rv2252/BmrU family lipid kinase